MAISAGATAGGTTQTTNGSSRDAAAMPSVPFIRASQEHREPFFDVSRSMTTADQDYSVTDVTSYGYLRAIVLIVEATGGAGTTVTLTEDAPFNALKNVQLTEPNGAVILSVSSGYSLFLINKFGGYRGFNDPRHAPSFSTAVGATADFAFVVRIPVELNGRDALGSLPNQNAAAAFKLRLTLAKVADVFSGTVSTAPTVRVRGYIEAWDQPEAATAGAANQVTPPAMNTTQFWTEQVLSPGSGQQTLRLTRMGNYIRNLIVVNRRAASRANGDTDFPDPLSVRLDTRIQDTVAKLLFKDQMWERYGYRGTADSANALENGVFAYDFTHEFDGVAGHENRDLWLPTLGSTRLDLEGSWGQAGSLTVLTNDVGITGNVFL